MRPSPMRAAPGVFFCHQSHRRLVVFREKMFTADDLVVVAVGDDFDIPVNAGGIDAGAGFAVKFVGRDFRGPRHPEGSDGDLGAGGG